jgi:hypothetical protein
LFNRSYSLSRELLSLRVPSCCWVATAGLLALWSVGTIAQAASWFFQPAVAIGTGYEENAGLDEEDSVNTSSYNVGVSARGGRSTGRSQVIGTLAASFTRYPGNEELDENNLLGDVSFTFLPTERDLLSLDLSIDRDTSRSSELTTTGNISGNVPRLALGIGASWQHLLTERSAFGVRYGRSGTSFDNNLSGLVNSQQDDIETFYSYQLTERLTFQGALNASFYNPTNDQSYKGYVAGLGMTYEYSETLRGGLGLGWERIDRNTDLDTATNGSAASGLVYDFTLSKVFERDRSGLTRSGLDLSLSRGTVPTGSGEPVLQESLNVGYSYWVSPRLRATIPLGVYRNQSISFGDAEEDEERRIFFVTEPSLSWRVTENVVLTASYRYQYQRFEEADRTADSNAFFLSLSYVWPSEIRGRSL